MNTSNRTKTASSLSARILVGSIAALLATPVAQAVTYVWDPTNVTGTPPAILDWFTGGSNPLGLWTGVVVPVSDPTTTIQFFADTTTSLPNTAVPSTQTVNLNNGGSAFQLGTLTLNGFGSATSAASLTMTLQGDALNFSAATGTISFNSVKNVAPATDPVVNYTINNNIQLGTASSASALTLTGNGDNAGTTTYLIGGTISELQSGGGSLLKSGTSLVTISGAINITGAVTVSAGTLTLSSSTNTASTMTVNGGTLVLTGNLNPPSASMTVNTGGILQIGNNTATQFGPAGVYSRNISTGTGGTLRLWSSSSQEISGIISGSGGINKAYGGALTLSGLNTYTGQSVFKPQNTTGFTANVSSFDYITSGTYLNHGLGSSLGAPTTVANGTIDVGNLSAQAGTTLNYTGGLGETTDRVLNFAGNGSSTSTITTSGGGLLKFTSDVAVTPLVRIALGGTGNGEISGNIGVTSGALTKSGAGTWTLSGTNGITGATTISASGGILNLTSATALQNSPFDTASAAGTGSIGLRITTTTLTLGGLTGSNPLKGRFTTATGGPSNATANGGYADLTNLTLNTVGGSTLVYTGAIVEGATGMSLTKTGAGIQTLNATHTYTGTTSVNGGFLQLNGSTLTGGLSVSNAHFASNSTFAGLASVTSGGIISPGASSGAIGNLTLTNVGASALTLNGSTGIFDLPATTAAANDRIAVTGGLVNTGTNTILLRTSSTGTAAGVYTLMTSSVLSGAGSFVLANGSATRGNATVSTSGNDVILTVAGAGLAVTTTYTGASGAFNAEKWNVTTNWNSGVVPTGTTNVVLPDQTSAFNIPVFATTPTYSGDLWIGNNVTLQVGSTTGGATFNNALGTPGSTIIYMGQNSTISSRNTGFNPTMPQIILLGDATMRFQESTQGAVTPDFANSISGPFTLTLNSGVSGTGATHNLNAANSFAGLALTTGASNILNANASGSIGTANLTISGGGTVNLNHASAITDNSNPIRIDNGTLTYGTTSAAPLTLSTRPIELNGAGQATINNNNTASSSANILTLAGGISSTAAGAKTLTLGGANTGLNAISGIISDGTGGGTVAVTKTGAGTWVLGGTNSYTGATTITGGTLRLANTSALATTSAIAMNTASSSLVLGTDTAFTTLPQITGGSGAFTYTFVSDRATTGAALNHGLGTINFGSATFNFTQGSNVTSGTAGITFASAIMTSGTAGTAIISPTTATLTITGGVTSQGNNVARTLQLDGTGTGSIGGVITQTVASALSLTKSNTSTWTLAGNNSYTGATTVSAGTLTVTNTKGLGGTSGIIFGSGGTAVLTLITPSTLVTSADAAFTAPITGAASTTGNYTINVDYSASSGVGFNQQLATLAVGASSTAQLVVNAVNLTSGTPTLNFTSASWGQAAGNAGIITANMGVVIAGNVTNLATSGGARTLTLQGTATNSSIGGIISDGTNAGQTTAITKTNAGTWTLGGGSTYTGPTTVTAGTLAGIGTNAFGSTSGISIAAASSATLSLRGDTNTDFRKASDSSFYSVTTTANGATINVDQATIAGTGAKTMTIGTLALNNAVTNGTTFTGANNTSLSIGAVTTAAAASGTETLTNNIASTGSLTLASVAVTRTGTPTLAFAGTGNTTVTGNITQAFATILTKSGNGTLTLGGTSSHSGATTISGGSLQLGSGGATGSLSATASIANNANVTVNRSNPFTQVTDLNNKAITGTGSFTQAGGGTTTLSSTGNNYSGATTVSAGTLEVTGSLTGTSGVTVNTGGTLLLNSAASDIVKTTATVAAAGGTVAFGNTANQVQTFGALTLNANLTLDFGAGGVGVSGNDKFSFAGFVHTAGTGVLSINNWSGNLAGATGNIDGNDDRLVFSGDFNTFISAFNQADVSFNGGSGYAAIDFGGTSYEIVPVPEPATTALIGSVALCALIGYRERRRMSRKTGAKSA